VLSVESVQSATVTLAVDGVVVDEITVPITTT
jgi:hypothetical protein